MFNVAMKENGTIIQFQDLHQVLTNVYVDYQLLKTRGREPHAEALLSHLAVLFHESLSRLHIANSHESNLRVLSLFLMT